MGKKIALYYISYFQIFYNFYNFYNFISAEFMLSFRERRIAQCLTLMISYSSIY